MSIPLRVVLRPAMDADLDFLARVFASTRERELAMLPPGDEGRSGFVAQQFAAQRAHLAAHYPDATCDVILVDGEPSGRLVVARWDEEIRILDIALLPHHRGRGVGERLLRDVLEEGAERGAKVTIRVEHSNPARRLYERLGFVPVSHDAIGLEMEAHAKTAS